MNSEEIIQDLIARVTELESREAFHEYNIELLNQTIIEQQEKIEHLTQISQQLINKVKEIPSNDDKQWTLEEEIPPHY